MRRKIIVALMSAMILLLSLSLPALGEAADSVTIQEAALELVPQVESDEIQEPTQEEVASAAAPALEQSLLRGETLQLTIPDKTIKSCESKDRKVATVTKAGLVTGVRHGEARIVVKTTDKEKYTFKISVVDPYWPTDVKIVDLPEILLLGDEVPLQAEVTSLEAPADTALEWKSSKKKVARVTDEGTLQALKPGVARITVKTDNKLSDTLEVTVIDPSMPTDIAFDEAEVEIRLSRGTIRIRPVITAIGDPNETLKWKSGNKKVAKVDKEGVITLKSGGKATITATTVNKLKASFVLNVVDDTVPTGIAIQTGYAGAREIYLPEKGDLATLEADLEGENPITRLKWTTSNKKVAKVTQDETGMYGTVTAVGAGYCTITVTTSNKLSASVIAVVMGGGDDYVPSTVVLWPGDSRKLDLLKGQKDVSYSSSDPDLVSVDSDGTVTMLGAYTGQAASAEVTAVSGKGKVARCSVYMPNALDAIYANGNLPEYVGQSGQMTVDLRAQDISHTLCLGDLRYEIEDTDVAVISMAEENGRVLTVKAVGPGETTLKLTSVNGVTQTVQFAVKAMSDKVIFDIPDTLYAGYYYNLTALITPEDGDLSEIQGFALSTEKYGYLTSYRTPVYAKGLSWTSDRGDTCYYVDGYKEGSVTLTVTLKDGRQFSKKLKVTQDDPPEDISVALVIGLKNGGTSVH